MTGNPCRAPRRGRGATTVAMLLAALACCAAVQALSPARAHAKIALNGGCDWCDEGSGGGYGDGGSGGYGDPGSGDYGDPESGDQSDPGSGSGSSGAPDPNPADDPDPSTGLGPNSGSGTDSDTGPDDPSTDDPNGSNGPATAPTDPGTADPVPDPNDANPPVDLPPDWYQQHAPTMPIPLPPTTTSPSSGDPCEYEAMILGAAKPHTVAEEIARINLDACLKANGIPVLTARVDPPPAHTSAHVGPVAAKKVMAARRGAAAPKPAKARKRAKRTSHKRHATRRTRA